MTTTRAKAAAPLAVALALGAAACGGKSGPADATVTATDDSCQVSTTSFQAGKTTFKIENKGGQVTEVYVYGPGDKVVEEREDIGPGTSATLTADLDQGAYQVACKPGMRGDGIRTAITVKG